MTTCFWNCKSTAIAALLAGTVAITSCNQQPAAPQPIAAPAPTTTPTGRFQVATVSEGERGSTLVLLDSVSGETWLFHPPQGPLYNGFWGDVPRVTSPGDSWRQAFQTMLQPAQPGAQPSPTPPTNRPATGTTTPPR